MQASIAKEHAVKSGDVIDGRYRVIKTIGEGGMGTVFLAEHTLIKRRVAVKVLHAELAADANVVERFMNEARAAGTLGHANIVESTDMGFLPSGVPYIVFEYLEGSALTDEVYRLGGLPVRRAVRVATQIASALHAAHAANIVHRDLKSENVFLTDRHEALDHVKVLDFGISKFLEAGDSQTRRGMIMGTPEFMAPEQISDPDNVDARVDIYALGVILYEMLCGRRPFQNDDPRTLLHRILHNEPPPIDRPEVPHGLLDVLATLLQKDPAMRFQTMAEVETALSQFGTVSDSLYARQTRGTMGAQPTSHTDLDVPGPTTSLLNMSTAAMATPWPGGHASLNTPWPTAANAAMLPVAPRAKQSPVLYGMVGLGLIVGAAGLYMGMRGAPAPAAPVAAAPITPATTATSTAAGVADTKAAKIAITIDADAPGARVTLRRRVADAPTTTEISPNDIVELVEVSAPGRKTVRYWLTFDRPTRLVARLPMGTGAIEATEEETMIALGEAVVVAPVIAALAVAPTAKAADATANEPRAKPVAVAMPNGDSAPTVAAAMPTPRKIGRDADGAATGAVAGSGSDAGSSAPVVDPRATPTRALVPTVETAVTRPAAPVDVAPVAPVAPVVKAAPKQLEGISRAEVAGVAGKNRPAVMGCFATGRKTNATLAGSVTVNLVINEAGKVVRQQVQSTMASPLVAACVLKGLPAWSFAARPDGGNVNATYTFTLK